MRRLFLILSLAFISVNLLAKEPNAKADATNSRLSDVQIALITDSAMVMIDDYAEALSNKPEFAKTRMNLLGSFYNSQQKPVQDTIRSRIFDLIIYYTENENNERMEAFRNCFETLAPSDDKHRGPLYTLSLETAIQEHDTISVKECIRQLNEYAALTDTDFDSEITAANDFIYYMRTRCPINEELMGVWVSEGICTDKTYVPSFFDDNKNKYKELERSNHILLITDNKVLPIYPRSVDYVDFLRTDYEVPAEISSDSKFWRKTSYLFNTLSPNSWLYKDEYFERHPQIASYDEDLRSGYFVWSNEAIDSFDPEYYASLRQTLQQTTAHVHGNLARKKVSTAKRIWGGAAMNTMYNVGNNLLDRLAVSSASFWAREMTIRMDAPMELTIWTFIQYNVAKSNSDYVKTWEKDDPGYKYYKWEPNDDVFFVWQNGDLITLGEVSSDKKKECKQYYKDAKAQYEAQYGKLGRSGDKYNAFHNWFNTNMFNKLKIKAQE